MKKKTIQINRNIEVCSMFDIFFYCVIFPKTKIKQKRMIYAVKNRQYFLLKCCEKISMIFDTIISTSICVKKEEYVTIALMRDNFGV